MKNINELIDKYPTLLDKLDFGIECGPGWFDLIDKLCEDILKLDPTCIASQVKEKYGGLRFYCSSATDDVFDRIDEAEVLSEHTCEVCGEPGKLTGEFWLSTLCEKCKNER